MHWNTGGSLKHCQSVLLLLDVLLDFSSSILEPVLVKVSKFNTKSSRRQANINLIQGNS